MRPRHQTIRLWLAALALSLAACGESAPPQSAALGAEPPAAEVPPAESAAAAQPGSFQRMPTALERQKAADDAAIGRLITPAAEDPEYLRQAEIWRKAAAEARPPETAPAYEPAHAPAETDAPVEETRSEPVDEAFEDSTT